MNYNTNKEKDDYFLRKAIELAKHGMNNNSGGPFGAIIVKGDKIVGKGFNKVTATVDPTAHAEVVAIRDACHYLNSFQLHGCTLYTSCEPCPMCLGAIYWARPDRIVFAATRQNAANIGFDDDFIYREIELPIEERNIQTENKLQAEGKAAMELWLEKANKIEY